ncbi:MAG: alpha/beta hydrolase [Friedmanniella sp.]|nr:alpha/beta hydrolase [Friedmanniella sp.]
MPQSIEPVVILDSESHVIWSEVVGDHYQLSVWLPPSYRTSTSRYPVLFALDAPVSFGVAAHGTLISIYGELVPEVIVVGVGQPVASAYEWGPTRARDYNLAPVPGDVNSGHGAAFAECLRTQIVPFVDREYRTDTSDRGLWGHSSGGALALSLLLQRPGLVHRVIATSPAVVDQGVAQLDPDRWPAAGSAVDGRLFVSVGSADEDYRPHIETFLRELRGRRYQRLQVDDAVLPGLGHVAAAAPGFLAGLAAVYSPATEDEGGSSPAP